MNESLIWEGGQKDIPQLQKDNFFSNFLKITHELNL